MNSEEHTRRIRVIVTNYTRFVRCAWLLLVPIMLPAADLTPNLIIDHVTVAGKDLKVMQATLAALGIPTEYGGPHSNHATEMALTSFPDGSYLELIAIQPNADPAAVAAHYWSKEMQNDAGPSAWAIRPKDLGADVKRLQASGIVVSSPTRAGRARPDGVALEWETANVGKEPNGTFFPFMIRDFTPREQRRRSGTIHPYPQRRRPGGPRPAGRRGGLRGPPAVRVSRGLRPADAGPTGGHAVRRAAGFVPGDSCGARNSVERAIVAGWSARENRRRTVCVHLAPANPRAKCEEVPSHVASHLVRNRDFMAEYRENGLVAGFRVNLRP